MASFASLFAASLAGPHQWTERLLILCMGLMLDAIIGEAPKLFQVVPHPVVIIGKLIAALEHRLNRPTRSGRDRRVRGVVLLVVMGGGALLIGTVVSLVAAWLPYGWIIELVIVGILVAQRSLYTHVVAVARGLETGGLMGGREAVSHIVGRDPQSLDQAGVCRAAIESLAENFSDGVVAPVLAYVCLGLPGMLLYKTVNTLDSMVGHKNTRYQDFGWASARFDDLVNLVPARLSGLLISFSAIFAPNARPKEAFQTMLQDAGRHRSPNAGWPEAAMAGALGLALAGPRRYGNLKVEDPWLGAGSVNANVADIRRALAVYLVACLVMIGTMALVAALII